LSRQVMLICLSNGWGGLEMYPSRIIPELRHQGWEAHGLALAGSRVAASLREAGIAPLTVASRGRALLAVPRLLAYLKAEDIRVLHCHKSSDLRLGALLATLRPSLRLVFTDHMGVTRPKKDLYHRWAYGRVARVLSISEATRRRNREAFPLPAERIRRLYLGIDPAPYAVDLVPAARDALREELGVAPGSLAIGLPGRLTPGKGQSVWVEALGRLALRRPDLAWRGVLIGGLTPEDGSDAAHVEALRRRVDELGLGDRITFAGFRRDLPRVLQALDIVCIPSRNEAFGLTVIEAMAAGRAVIGSDSGAIPELLADDAGRLAPPDDPDAWARLMAALAEDERLRRRLGRTARRRVTAHFSLAAHVRGLVACYAGE
jgi:glycosyltransferase involved in cell wall biosynthesis